MPFVLSQIISIISAYRYISVNVRDRFAEYVLQLQKQLIDIVSKKKPVRFILPAFPFKAPAEDNKSKTLDSPSRQSWKDCFANARWIC